MLLNLRKRPVYLLIIVWFFLVWIYFSLYASDNEGIEKKIIKQSTEKDSTIPKNISIIWKEDKVEKELEDEIKQKTEVKQIRFTAKQNKRFLNLSEKARKKLKKEGTDIFIKLPKQYYHCNKFWCYLNYERISKSKKKHFIVKKIDSKTKRQESTVYLISYNIKDKWFDITSRLKRHTIQDRALSCESSSAADIISFLTDSTVTEKEIINKIKWKGIWFNKEPEINEKTWRRYWGNPNVWFVWYIDDFEKEIEVEKEEIDELLFESDLSDIDELIKYEKTHIKEVKTEKIKVKARQHAMNWYWIYETPFLSVYSSYNLKSKIINIYYYKKMWLNPKSHLKKLLIELKKWNMVQLWWDYCTLSEFEDGVIAEKNVRKKEIIIESWKFSAKNTCGQNSDKRKLKWYVRENWKDRLFTWLSGEHNFYLLWYNWDINHPSSIIVWDTYTWKHTYPIKEWYRKWWLMQNRSMIISKN